MTVYSKQLPVNDGYDFVPYVFPFFSKDFDEV